MRSVEVTASKNKGDGFGSSVRMPEKIISPGRTSRLSESAIALALLAGLPKFWRYRNRNKLLILAYHAVVSGDRPYDLWTHLHVDRFREQVQFLKRHYQLLSLRDAVDKLARGQDLPTNAAVITFDDGYENNSSVAFPVLQQEQVPATMFLTTGFLDSGEFNWPDLLYLMLLGTPLKELDLADYGLGRVDLRTAKRRHIAYMDLLSVLKNIAAESKTWMLSGIGKQMGAFEGSSRRYWQDFAPMSWAQAREMQASGLVDFGAHSVNHEILSRLAPDKIRHEIAASCNKVTEMLGISNPAFAYPNGSAADFDENALSVLRELKLPCAVTTVDGLCDPDEDRFGLRRIGIGANMSLGRFELACSGLLSSCKNLLSR